MVAHGKKGGLNSLYTVLLDQRIANLLITPHVAWASAEAKQALADELIDCVEAFERGERLNRLD